MSGPPVTDPLPKLRTVLWRGWCRRCPQCGQGPLYVRWLKLHERCSACGLQFVENEGDLWGMLLFVDRLVFIIPIISLIYLGLWRPDFTFFLILGSLTVFLLVYTMPHRNGVSVGLDYLFRRRNYFTGDKPEVTPEVPPATPQNNPCGPGASPLDSRPNEQTRRH